jgi:hypothetical protein
MQSLKPIKTVLPLREFNSRVSKGNWLVQRKYDGVFTHRRLVTSRGNVEYVSEVVKMKSGFQGTLDDRNIIDRFDCFEVPLTLISINGQSFLGEPNLWRFEKLQEILSPFETVLVPHIVWPETFRSWHPPSCFVPDGEGLVAHPADGPWGQMLCVKNRQDSFVRALAFPGGRLSVQVEETDESMNARQSSARAFGNIPVSQKIACQIQPGMVLKITAAAVTAAGMFREARLCDDSPDSWCVKNV